MKDLFRGWSLRSKIVVSVLLVEIVLLTALVWNGMRLMRDSLIEQTEQHIANLAPLLNASLAGPLFQEDLAAAQEILERVIRGNAITYAEIRDVQKNVILTAGARREPVRAEISFREQIEQRSMSAPYSGTVVITLAGQVVGSLFYQMDTSLITQAIDDVQFQGTTIAAVEIGLSFILLAVLAMSLTRHLRLLTHAAVKLRDKRCLVPLQISSSDEIGQLSAAFREMAQRIVDRERELKESEARIRLLLESTAEAIYGVDGQGQCTFANTACARLLGFDSADALLGRDMRQPVYPCREHPEAACSMADRLSGVLRSGRGIHIENEILRRQDGGEFPAEYWIYPVRPGQGAEGAVVTFLDITKRVQAEIQLREQRDRLEDLVRARTSELEATNKELEAFCYSVSHDLRAPLRSIDGFSQALAEDCADRVGQTGAYYIERIRCGAQRMSALIEDVLKLSRVVRQDINRLMVDLSRMVSEIIAELQKEHPDRNVLVHVEKDIIVVGDPPLLKLALTNLLNNAWKYTAKTPHPRIEFYQQVDDRGQRCFVVRDNGAGFDMRYADRLFAPFQRLHPESQFSGTGIGLAIAHRVFRRHGGDIWAEAVPGEGAAFYFSITSGVKRRSPAMVVHQHRGVHHARSWAVPNAAPRKQHGSVPDRR